jgi:two-component system response regulator RegA
MRTSESPHCPPSSAVIADVDCSDRRQLAAALATRGFVVHASDELSDVAELARHHRAELVVLETRLREGSGLELLPPLRAELPGAKLVVVTHYGSVASAVRAMRLGATNYLCKPASAEQILLAASHDPATGARAWPDELGSPLTLDQAIWEYIHHTLEMSGSISEAARRLGLWRQSLKRMIEKYRPAPARGLQV